MRRAGLWSATATVQSVRALRFVLHGAGFGVDATYTAEEALDRVAVRPPDATIVELVCRRLREWSAMPVIVLWAESKEELKVQALETGADDNVPPGHKIDRLRRSCARLCRLRKRPVPVRSSI